MHSLGHSMDKRIYHFNNILICFHLSQAAAKRGLKKYKSKIQRQKHHGHALVIIRYELSLLIHFPEICRNTGFKDLGNG